MDIDIFIKCMICNKCMKVITNSHLKRHNINFQEYKKKFPHSKTMSIKSKKTHRLSMIGRKLTGETKRKISLSHKGKKLTEETKKKLSIYFKGRKLTEEHKQKIKDYYKTHDNPFKGKKHSIETKRKMSLSRKGKIPWNKGKTWSEKIKKRISAKLKGTKLSLETRKKMSIAQKGKILKESTKQKMSKAKKGISMTPEHRRKLLESINKSPNKFEKKCIELFKKNKLPLKFVGGFNDKNFFIAGKVPDFISTNNKKVIVEVFYEYFKIRQYGSVENYKKDRINTFSKYGWKTLFFTCNDIRLNFDECLRKLKKELG